MPTTSYPVVSTKAEAVRLIKRAKRSGLCALDLETTSLSPETGKVRLIILNNGKLQCLIDCFKIKGGFESLAPHFQGGEWVVFYKGFEQRWFNFAIHGPGYETKIGVSRLYDLANLRRAIIGGGHLSLANMAKWDLEREMDKTLQASDWGAKELTPQQLQYASDDGTDTWDLWNYWFPRADVMHLEGLEMFDEMVPAVIEMEEAGFMLDIPKHRKLIKAWEKERDNRLRKIRRAVSEDEVKKITSDVQWSDYFSRHMPDEVLAVWPRTEKTGQLQMTVDTLKQFAAFYHGKAPPLQRFFDALAEFKTISKYISSFGDTLITMAKTDNGILHPSYNIGAAKTGRFSSSKPNVQQTPRNRELLGTFYSVRESLRAEKGFRLVGYDYSGIELRVLAILSGDKQLLEDVVWGDVHLEVAQVMAGRKIDKTTAKGSSLRSSAKPVSFGIIYGIGAPGLSASMRTTRSRAQDYIDSWTERYPHAFHYRHDIMEEARGNEGFVRMVDGGTIYMRKKPDLPKAANYPVQRAALSVMARAIIRHKASLDHLRNAGTRRQRQQFAAARMLATIHDQLIDKTKTAGARTLDKVMQEDMIAGYTDIFPMAPLDNLIEGGIGKHWGEL